MTNKGFNTRLLHAAYPKKDPHGALQAPLYITSAFEFDTSEDIEGAFKGTRPAHAYSRSGNPTVEIFESRIKSVTNAQAVVAFSSGMAAISAAILAVCKSGDNIISTKKLFGNTYAFFENDLKNFGIEVRYANFLEPQSIVPLIDNNTRMLFSETINNPQLEVLDVEAVAQIAKKYQLLFCADTTLTPPCAFNASGHGIHIEVISGTKYISSGAATIGGLVIDHGGYNCAQIPLLGPWVEKFGNQAFNMRLRKDILRNMGACLSPFNAYIQLLGLETMQLRFDKMTENALMVAKWLLKHPKVTSVNYPGLENSKFYQTAQKYYSKNGGLLTFCLQSQQKCNSFMNQLQLIKRATNLNDNKSLIIHPASTIFSEFSAQTIAEMEISDTLLRLSVGIEDADDIIFDLEQALEKV